jgi:hypothetical protein
MLEKWMPLGDRLLSRLADGTGRRFRYRALILATVCWCGLALALLHAISVPASPRMSSDARGRKPISAPQPMLGDSMCGPAVEPPAVQEALATGGITATTVPPVPQQDDRMVPQRNAVAQITASAPEKPAVLIYHRLGSAAGQQAALRIAEEVRKAGGDLVGIRTAVQVPATRELRYLRAADAAEGNKLAMQFKGRWGNAWRVAALAPNAGSRRFEIWLPHH